LVVTLNLQETSMRVGSLMVLPLTALVLAACGGDGTGPSQSVSLTGGWQYAFNVSNSAAALSCTGTGSMTLTQSGSQFSGAANGATACSGPGGELTDQGTTSVTGGQINGTQVSLQFQLFEAGCTGTGTASGTPTNSMNGTATCTFAYLGQQVTMTGTWQASR
jgi:hypothetical protein